MSTENQNGILLTHRHQFVWLAHVLGLHTKHLPLINVCTNIHWFYFLSLLPVAKESSWPAVSLLLQNVLIFLGSLVFKFGRSEETF